MKSKKKHTSQDLEIVDGIGKYMDDDIQRIIEGKQLELGDRELPPFDEYLISYKDRTAAMDKEHHPKAFNNFGIFYPVILYNGQIVGNWKKVKKKGGILFETSFFVECPDLDRELLEEAGERYKAFYNF